MNHFKSSRIAIFSSILGIALISAHAQSTDTGPDRYIIQLKEGTSLEDVASNHGVRPDFVYKAAVHGLAGKVAPGQLRALKDDPRVLSVVPDRLVTAIGKPVSEASAPAPVTPAQVIPAGVQKIGAAPGSLSVTGNGIGVAVVDTGLDFNHADLQPLGNVSFSAFTSPSDDNGHGTHVGGIIAARNNSRDVVGVAPNATLYAVKVLNQNGSGSDATIIAGLDWVAANESLVSPPIRVVNMSLGRLGNVDDNPSLRTAVQTLTEKGIAVIVAAGNDANTEVSQQVPATYPEVIAVASTTARNGTNANRRFNGFIPADTASYFTTDGRFDPLTGIGVTISAPGEEQENISKAGFIESVGILSTKLGGGTTRLSGTSMAAPHVAGVITLIYEQAGGNLLTESARNKVITGASNLNAPLDSPTSSYSFDGEREGVLSAPGALAIVP
jgi:subtilisin